MHNYQTVEEKSAAWNLSSRHVQYLCRNGKIEGAIKRAGSWFIPGDTASPAKNSKSDAGEFNLAGTKKRIFNSAIELFTLNGVDSVTLRDIAEKAGVRQSTIYNHFSSKSEILDAIYNFYCHFYLKDRPSLEDIAACIQNESPLDIIFRIRYNFDDEYLQKMSDITKIIFQRIGIDDRAKEIAKSLMLDEGIQYIEDIFNRAVQDGRYAPFDTHVLSVFINSIRVFTLFNWIIDPSPDSTAKLMADEHSLYKYAAGFIKTLNV